MVRECGTIVSGGKEEEGSIRAAPLIAKLRKLAEDRSVAGIVLHVDSGGVSLHAVAHDFICRGQRSNWLRGAAAAVQMAIHHGMPLHLLQNVAHGKGHSVVGGSHALAQRILHPEL